MSTIYFPGCKYTALSPLASEKIQGYLAKRYGAAVTGCCRVNHTLLATGDTALCVCPTCLFMLQKSAPEAKAVSVWEVLAEDDKFPWPDYAGEAITIQDCVDTKQNPGWQRAVRRVLTRMNVRTVEIEKSFERADFCNIDSQTAPPSREERLAVLRRHCAAYTTGAVACYCTGCLHSLHVAGVRGVHLMDMVAAGC